MGKRHSVVENRFGIILSLLVAALLAVYSYGSTKKVDLESKLDQVVIIGVNNKPAGTGFFFDNTGCIMTAYHVVDDAFEKGYPIHIVMRGDPRMYDAMPVVFLEHMDIAVICSNEAKRPGLRIVYSDGIKIGTKVWAIGHPSSRTWNMTSGIISRMAYKNRPVGNEWVPRFNIFTDAFISWGNSGGPLINENGDVVGMIVEWDNPRINHPNGINVAVPGTDLIRFQRSMWGR